jgi:hypothetical protein
MNISQNQNVNTRSSTKSEIVGVDNVAGPMLWTARFLQAQGCNRETILYQDSKSSILLENNGRQSAGKRSRYLDI